MSIGDPPSACVAPHCPHCRPHGIGWGAPLVPYPYTPVALPQQGCICPAGAEKTCEGPLCPRRRAPSAASATP